MDPRTSLTYAPARGYRSGDRALLAEAWASPYLFPLGRPWTVATAASMEPALRDPARTRAVLLDGGSALALYRAFDWVEQRCALSIHPTVESATPDQLAGWLLQATEIAWNEWNVVRLYGEMSSEQAVQLAALERTPWQVEARLPRCLLSWPGPAASDLLYVGCLRQDAPRHVVASDSQPGRQDASRPDPSWSFQVLERGMGIQVAAWFREPTFFFTTSRPHLLTEAAIQYNLFDHPGRRCYVALRHEIPVALGYVDWQPERRIVGLDFRMIPDRARPIAFDPPDAHALLGEFLRLVERLYLPRAIVHESMPVDSTGNALFAAHGFAARGRRYGHIYRHNLRHDLFVSVRVPEGGY